MSFDDAQDEFRAAPSLETAANYLFIACQYWHDGMIGDDTLKAAIAEVLQRDTP